MKEEHLNIETDDLTLISYFKSGNHSAFNLLVQKYQKKIYWVIRKMVVDHDDANDITQDVFIKIYDSLGDFRGDSKFFTYIYRIAVNYSLNYLTRNKRIATRKVDIETESYRIKSDERASDDEYDNKLRQQMLEDAVSRLPDQQRAVFNMRYYDNLSYEEIAEILNKSVGGMKANYFHAVKKIQEYVKQNDEKKIEL